MQLNPSSKLIVLLALTVALFVLPINASLHAETVQAPTDTSASGELVFWNSIKKSENSADFEVYLKIFPDGMFADIAQARYKALGGAAVVATPKVEDAVVAEPEAKEAVKSEPELDTAVANPEPAKPVLKTKPKKRVSSVFVKKNRPKVILEYSKNHSKKKSKWASTQSKRKSVKKTKRPVVLKAKYSKPKPRPVKKKVYVPENEPRSSGSGSGGGGGGGSSGGGGGWGG